VTLLACRPPPFLLNCTLQGWLHDKGRTPPSNSSAADKTLAGVVFEDSRASDDVQGVDTRQSVLTSEDRTISTSSQINSTPAEEAALRACGNAPRCMFARGARRPRPHSAPGESWAKAAAQKTDSRPPHLSLDISPSKRLYTRNGSISCAHNNTNKHTCNKNLDHQHQIRAISANISHEHTASGAPLNIPLIIIFAARSAPLDIRGYP